MSEFRVDLDLFRGPLDLLMYLVRKHELDVADLPIGEITEQYWSFLEVLEAIDINAVGDFVEVASTLIEIKSRQALPKVEEPTEQEQVLDDPRDDLVRRLLEYKRFRDAASMLEERGRQWQQRFTRVANDLPQRELDPADQPIHEVELWDLVSAFGRLMRVHEGAQQATILYDDTPIQTHMRRIHQRLIENGSVTFSEMFASGMHKSALIGIFLAVLELVRHHRVIAEQDELSSEIIVRAGEHFSEEMDFADVDTYEHRPAPK